MDLMAQSMKTNQTVKYLKKGHFLSNVKKCQAYHAPSAQLKQKGLPLR